MAESEHAAGDSTVKAFALDFPVTLTAIIHPEESGGFWAEVPALPGCFTEGETLDEVRVNLREAAEGWLKAQHDLLSATLDREAPGGGDKG
jgi:predicted RNase H-like HicB family nuclease